MSKKDEQKWSVLIVNATGLPVPSSFSKDYELVWYPDSAEDLLGSEREGDPTEWAIDIYSRYILSYQEDSSEDEIWVVLPIELEQNNSIEAPAYGMALRDLLLKLGIKVFYWGSKKNISEPLASSLPRSPQLCYLLRHYAEFGEILVSSVGTLSSPNGRPILPLTPFLELSDGKLYNMLIFLLPLGMYREKIGDGPITEFRVNERGQREELDQPIIPPIEVQPCTVSVG